MASGDKRLRRALLVGGLLLAVTAGLGPVAREVTMPRDLASSGDMLTGYGDPRVTRRDGEEALAYVERATQGISDAVIHCEGKQRFENQTWASDIATQIGGADFSAGEAILLPDHLWCGLCGQHAIVLAEILRQNGIESADPYLLNGHTVTEFEVDGLSYSTDPDIGVGPFEVEWDNPEQLRDAANDAYRDHVEPSVLSWAQRVYSETEGDHEYDRAYYVEMQASQAALVGSVETARWVLVGFGLLFAAPGLRRTLGVRQRSPARSR